MLTIDRDNKLPRAQDYGFLRKEAISLIQSLSGETWTDYNTHDPGITLLEAICYALTDLGYRTSFDLKDILSPQKANDGAWDKVFYTARRILPCNPLTLIDYRKLIIDTEGVRNAWIEKSDDYEILMYLQKAEKKESEKQRYNLTYDSKKGEEVLRLRGLYKVVVDYEEYILKDKREEEIGDVIRKKLQFHRNLCEDFVSVTSIEYEKFPIEAVIQVSEGTDIELINAKIFKVIHDFFAPPVIFYSLEQMLEKNRSADEIFEGPALKYGFIDTRELEMSEKYRNIHLSDIIRLISGVEGVIAVKSFVFGKTYSPFSEFTEWVNNVTDIQKTPRLDIENSVITFVRSGDRHRPDSNKQSNKERVMAIFSFLEAADFRSRLKGTGKDLPVPAGEYMDIADYYPFQNNLPAAYGMTEKYIDDSVDQSSVTRAVNELLEQKAGSNLRRVFIALLAEAEDNDAVKKALEDLLTNTTGEVSSIKEIINRLLKNKSDHALLNQILNELFGEGETQASLKERLHKLIERNPYPVTISEKTSVLAMLALKTEKRSLLKINSSEDLELLNEAYRKHQIQRLGHGKQLTLQLKGFLMVFEQILADHLSQLAHTRELFSFDPSINQTYFPQVLEGIHDLESLFIDFKKYEKDQLRLVETEDGFNKTRNQMMNHLLARFSESMDKYSFFMQNFAGKKAGKKLIADKSAFLSDYVQISTYRGKSFDYTNPEHSWNSDNVEGLKKRICRLLGIENYGRRTIAPDAVYISEVPLDNDGIVRYVVMLTEPGKKENVLLESVQYENEGEARQILNYIIENGDDRNLYEQEGKKDRWSYRLKRATRENDFEVVAESRDFARKEERDESLNNTIETLAAFSGDENFHIIEHMLLRPKTGPREQTGKKRSSTIDPDTVTLLTVRNVPDKVMHSNETKKEVSFKFSITQQKNSTSEDITIWKLSLLDDDHEILVVNEDFTFYRHLTRRIKHIRDSGSDIANFLVDTKADGLYTFTLRAHDTNLAESKRGYRKREEMDKEIARLVNFFSYDLDYINGHIDDNNLAYYADPYSLQISIVIPDWHKRFRVPAFRHLLEKTIYLETPSHIFPNIYWLDHKEMKAFEEAYKLWLDELSGIETPDTDIVNKMIMALNELRK